MTIDNSIPVVCLDLKGTLLNTYTSMCDAATQLHLNNRNIWANVVGHTLRCNKYYFVDENYYNKNKNYEYEFRRRQRKFRKSIQ